MCFPSKKEKAGAGASAFSYGMQPLVLPPQGFNSRGVGMPLGRRRTEVHWTSCAPSTAIRYNLHIALVGADINLFIFCSYVCLNIDIEGMRLLWI